MASAASVDADIMCSAGMSAADLAEANALADEIEGRKGAWDAEEDTMLINLVSELGAKRWSLIAARMPGRIGKQVCGARRLGWRLGEPLAIPLWARLLALGALPAPALVRRGAPSPPPV